MKIVLATGIFLPDIGGPATYVQWLARSLNEAGHKVIVITYGQGKSEEDDSVIRVSRFGGFILRWLRYASAIRKHANDADIVYAFSSISCGVPLCISRVKKPKRILRLGGDFFWERATDRGSKKGLREWYSSHPISVPIMQRILRRFDHIVFSTRFQQKMYEDFYTRLPKSSVIENALPTEALQSHQRHDPFRLLFMGRLVAFKNLSVLLKAIVKLPGVRLTLIGSGPTEKKLRAEAERLMVSKRVNFLPPVIGDQRHSILNDYDMLILPSLTDISPNMALEARSHGLPVLLSQETGLSPALTQGMTLALLRSPIDIIRSVADAMSHYDDISTEASKPLPTRGWNEICSEHLSLFSELF
ncbi:glycosyltransferase family 4 protein [Candidatus Peregrinibacteria bacterium]|jgi:glycosyltransferase involved in cell wall biosynthesis|nr:glycosyltransferase family 4 protein [Candidatus Peregrinibacteria bacterium]MBT3598733.1 glycosyltransferase family 4 protein [Candidatus Peregrinibacteria bacterium]MBT4366853.1 glycosyltransferase family 4 protein [Candidatus Peregrinibacteria bacterium]MBT4585548.1 glycosyltransferase family 4 protein [Candidatus Peregrinibacteria bacterium]MBT6731257.1 glycosyltransferase family 4 protein [Candidatus Peregrinibacteria bacterium]